MSLKEVQQRLLMQLLNVKKKQGSYYPELKGPIQLHAGGALNIYRNNYQSNLIHALTDVYPVCKKLVGESFFHMMIREYIRQFPSHEPSLNTYGSTFAKFVAHFSPVAKLPYLSDIAKLEWCIYTARLGQIPEKVDWSKLETLKPKDYPRITLKRVENGSLLTSKYPIDQIWQLNQAEQVDKLVLEPIDLYLFIWCAEDGLYINRLEYLEYQLLSLLSSPCDLGTVCEELLTLELENGIIEYLPLFIQKGYIGSFDLPVERDLC